MMAAQWEHGRDSLNECSQERMSTIAMEGKDF
jgi:hypothetical protein